MIMKELSALQLCSPMEVVGEHRHMSLAKTNTCTQKELISRIFLVFQTVIRSAVSNHEAREKCLHKM